MKDWPADIFSNVEITFQDMGNDDCQVTINQTAIPEYDTYGKFVHLDNLEGGWRNMIFKRVEQIFGYPINK